MKVDVDISIKQRLIISIPQGIIFAVMVTFVSIMRGVETSQHNRVCDNESHVKLSILKGLREQHELKEARIHEFERRMDEAIAEVTTEVAKLQELVNKTHNEADEVMTEMENMTTPDLVELEELQICSEEDFVTDCCQVTTTQIIQQKSLYRFDKYWQIYSLTIDPVHFCR